jgi:hypothetical protein
LQVSAGGAHAPHAQAGEQLWEPVEPQVVVQLCVAPGVHVPAVQPLHGPHAQVGEHVRVSLPPPHVQARVSTVDGVHSPPGTHGDQPPQAQALEQVRVCVPHVPQLCVCVVARQHSPTPLSQPDTQSSSTPLHVSTGGVHEPHAQAIEQIWEPVEPQLVRHDCVVPRRQAKPSSVIPSQSSSTALQTSAAPGCTVASPSLQSVPVHAPSG